MAACRFFCVWCFLLVGCFMLISCGEAGLLSFWGSRVGAKLWDRNLGDVRLLGVSASVCGRYVGARSEGLVHILDRGEMKCFGVLGAGKVEFHPLEAILVVGGKGIENGLEVGKVSFFELGVGKVTDFRFKGLVRDFALSGDGTLLSVLVGNGVHFFDLKSKRVLCEWSCGEGCLGVWVLPSYKVVGVYEWGFRVFGWRDVDFDVGVDLGVISCFSFSADGRLLVLGSEGGEVMVLDVVSRGVHFRVLHGGSVNVVRFMGSKVVSGGSDGVLKVWDSDGGEVLCHKGYGGILGLAIVD